MPFAAVIANLGRILLALGAGMLMALLVALGFNEGEAAWAFGGAAFVTFFVGAAMMAATRGSGRSLAPREGFMLVVLIWLVPPFFAAIPFALTGALPSFTDALFEAMSGLTTTGATVITDLDGLEKSLLFWRAALQWMGGLAIIIIAMSVLPLLGTAAIHLPRREALRTGREALQPRIQEAITAIAGLYVVLTAACAVALWAVGMPGFDAVSHAMSTLSTGGFSTRDQSIGAFGNPWIDMVIALFMVVGAINFVLHWAAFQGRLRAYFKDPECRAFLGLALVAALAVAAAVEWNEAGSSIENIGHGLFSAVSILTTTGFANASPAGWHILLPITFLALMLIGGATGSTAGGLKVLRLMLLFKHGRRELAHLVHPHGVMRIKYGATPVPEPVMLAVWGFFVLFMLALIAVTLLLAAMGIDFRTALAASVAGFTNTGPGLGFVTGGASRYAELPDAAKWLLGLAMMMGRLELLSLLVLLSPRYWKR